MAKKLKAELEIDNTKAKRKVQETVASGGASMTGGGESPATGAASRLGKSLDNASANANKLARSASEGASRIGAMARAFGGIGVQIAARYAASQMQAGAAKDGVTILGQAGAGALMGSAAGPWGAVGGAALGAVNGAIEVAGEHDKTAAELAKAKGDFEYGEMLFANNRGFAKFLKGLTEVEGKDKIAESLDALAKKIEEYNGIIDGQVADARRSLEAGDIENASAHQAAAGANRSRVAAMEAAQDALQKEAERLAKEQKPSFRASTDALDALSRIGANFGGGDGAREQLSVAKDQLRVLKDIERKTGATTWQ